MAEKITASQSTTSEDFATDPNSPAIGGLEHENETETEIVTKDTGLIGQLHPLNRNAKDAFHALASKRDIPFYNHHCSFLKVESGNDSKISGCFQFSLSHLPQFAPLGWRIGRGRSSLKDLGVDILLLVDGEDKEDIAGIHARFGWSKGGGGFFLMADNLRGKSVTLNGQTLSMEQRLIPYHNTISIGECYYTLKFPIRTAEQEEQFQIELARFYSVVLSNSTPFVVPTPCGNEMVIGEWVVRNAIARGTFGHVHAVTHTQRGEHAAAKEIWRTPRNANKVDQEVAMAKRLEGIKHKHLATPFKIYHERIHSKVERARIINLLDDTWKPGSNDVVDKYILFSPLSTSTFVSLIGSKASAVTRMTLFTQVLEGISFLHGKGIIHRDIKPANLTVQSYDPPLAQIIDFGSATVEKKILYDYPGTIPYLAPEQRVGEYHGCEVDYWACGLVGLQILGCKISGCQVDRKNLNSIQGWIQKANGNESVLPLKACIQGMLQWEVGDRMTADEALKGPLAVYRERADNKRPYTE